MKKKGFTLIELLTVVFIISLLTALAFPQYRIAAEKARAAEAMQNIAALQQAMDLYLMDYEDAFPYANFMRGEGYVLDVDLRNGFSCKGYGYCDSKYFRYYAWCEEEICHVGAGRFSPNADPLYLTFEDPEHYILEVSTHFKDGERMPWTKSCNYDVDGGLGSKICKAVLSMGW